MTNEEIKSFLTDTNDGPVDRFIIISRGCALSALHPDETDAIANALSDEIEQYQGVLFSTEF